MKTIEIKTKEFNEYHITINNFEKDIDQSIDMTLDFLSNNNISAIYAFGFGNGKYYNLINLPDFPLTWIDGTYNKSDTIYGIYIFGIKGLEISKIRDTDNSVIGTYFESDDIRYIYLGDLLIKETGKPKSEQATMIFNNIKEILAEYDFEMKDIVRTWFYNSDIVDWYDEFNKIRTSFYLENKVISNLVPASTGIDGISHQGDIVASLVAIKQKLPKLKINEVKDSKLQNSATEYGSTFSRAVIIKGSELIKLTVSGTASINKKGETIHIGDTRKQIDHTINSITEILTQCSMDYSNVYRAFAYFKNPEDLDKNIEYMNKKIGNDIPIIPMNSKICRDDLLFEMELDAFKKLED